MSLKEITDASFQSDVLQSPLPTVVDFWAPWCGPCKMIAPVLEELSAQLQGKVQIVKMNIDQNPNTPSQFGVRSVPTLILFNNGKNISTKVGALAKPALLQWIESSI